MRLILATAILIICLVVGVVKSLNPMGILKTCVTDSQCKENEEFCDHTGVNPIGSCRKGYELGEKCHFDRHCKSKNCHLTRCAARKKVKDGLCSKDQHHECLDDQYCGYRTSIHKCTDKVCSGWCTKHSQCLSNKCCWFFRCKQPKEGCKKKS